MKKTKTLIAMICLAITIVGNSNASYAEEGEEPYIMEINVRADIRVINGYPPAIGCAPEMYYAETVMSDQTIADEDQYKDMKWKLERYDNVSKTYTLIETSEGEFFWLWLPYGTKEGQYKITATSKADPNVSGYTWKYMSYTNLHKNFCIFQKGSVKYGKIEGEEPGAGKVKIESYNPENKAYTSILPKCPYKTKDYTFVGWYTEGKLYQPGVKFVASRDEYRHVYFQAQWKPNFKKPKLVANKVGKNKIKLKWNRMIGGKGYKIYRATKKNGKYKLIKTIKNKLKTSWIDKKIKYGKQYYYKVAVYKKSKKKIIQKKSAWALNSTKAAKVKTITLSKSSINGIVGNSTKIKVRLTSNKGKRLSKKVRWYSSNKNIAKINKNTGTINFMNEGTCKIWAKSYSGKNSSKIKVTVVPNM